MIIHDVSEDGFRPVLQCYELECGCYFYEDSDGIAFASCELHASERRDTIIASCDQPQLTLELP